MGKIDCSKCENKHHLKKFGCKYDFRHASNAGGAAVDCIEDVWFCLDYEEIEEDNYDDYNECDD